MAPATADPLLAIHEVAERHLLACLEAMYREDVDHDPGVLLSNSPASAPFDGCETCCTREVLHAAWPELEKYFKGEK